MNTGMLWFDNDPQTELPEKVQRAADYYRRKYGTRPNLCLVNPSALDGEKAAGAAIEVEGEAGIQPHHFWVGQRGV